LSICIESLDKNKIPTLALANGLWIGEIPDELQDLTYAEQLLMPGFRCIVKVSSGMSKMRANAISFSNPVLMLECLNTSYRRDVTEVWHSLVTRSCVNNKADFSTPFL